MIFILAKIAVLSMIFSLLIFMITFGILGPVSGKYFDAQFKKKHHPVPYVFAVGFSRRCHRAKMYTFFLLCNGNPFINHTNWFSKERIQRYNDIWGVVNYRKLARKRDWVLAILHHTAFLMGLISIFLVIILGALMKHYGLD